MIQALPVTIIISVIPYLTAAPVSSNPMNIRPGSAWSDLLTYFKQPGAGGDNDREEKSVGETAVIHEPAMLAALCGQRPGYRGAGSRIVGGWTSGAVEVPWQAAIIRRPSSGGQQESRLLDIVCGAAVVTAWAAVTAGHCLKLSPEEYQVRLGAETSLAQEECHQQLLDVKAYVNHPQYNAQTLANDIAVLRLETPFKQGAQFNNYIMPICLPTIQHSYLFKQDTEALVSGFGVQSEGSSVLSQTLQSVELPIWTQDKCIQSYRELTRIGDTQFCAGVKNSQQPRRDACSGDSGGPLAVLRGGLWYLAGVVSFGLGCGRPEYPGVYTRVDMYTDWILEMVERKDISQEPPHVYSVGPMCQGEERYIWCDHGSVLKMETTFYGRDHASDQTKCPSQAINNMFHCELASSYQDLSTSCNGLRSCKVSSNLFSVNPCPHQRPYIEFSFTCHDMMGRSFTGGVQNKYSSP